MSVLHRLDDVFTDEVKNPGHHESLEDEHVKEEDEIPEEDKIPEEDIDLYDEED